MKKYIALTLVLFIISAAAIVTIATAISADSDRVTYTEKAVYGDKSIADGVRVTSSSHYKNHLVWDSVYTVGGDAVTDFEFHHLKKYNNGKPHLTALIIHSGINFGFNINKPASEQKGLAKLYKELYDTLDYEEEGNLTVRLADCYEFYPLDINVNLPNIHLSTQFNDFEDDSFYISTIDGQNAKSVYDKICEFIKIPVLEDEYVDIHVKKHRGNSVGFGHGYSDKSADYYSFSTYSTYTDKACYFTINNKTEQGKIVDFSHIPGGYGVYALPYGDSTLRVNELSMVYKLDDGVTVNYMTVNDEQTELIMSVIENGVTYLEVVDLATMNRLQKVEIYEGQSFIIFPMDGFITYEFADRVAVLEERDGVYELKFVCEKFGDGIGETEPFYFKSGMAMDFDGERLVIVDNLHMDSGWYDKCGFYIAVYGKEGLLYYGEYESSLDANAQSAYHYSFNCQPLRNFEVEW